MRMEPLSAQSRAVPVVLEGKSVAVLGCGKVGSAVAVLLAAAGLPIVAVTTRSAETAGAAAERTGATAFSDNATAAAQGDIVLITTNDDAIAEVAAEVAQAGGFREGQLVLHMSGALSLGALAPASAAGALTGCLHPLQSFATAEAAVRMLPASVFGLTASDGAMPQLEALVEALGGEAEHVRDEDKTLYHAAAVVASNYLVAVEDLAVRLLETVGFDETSASKALQPLVAGTVENVREFGPTNALTGPIVRGDVSTVRRHLEALAELRGSESELYRTLGRHTLMIAQERGTLSAQTVAELSDLLGG